MIRCLKLYTLISTIILLLFPYISNASDIASKYFKIEIEKYGIGRSCNPTEKLVAYSGGGNLRLATPLAASNDGEWGQGNGVRLR